MTFFHETLSSATASLSAPKRAATSSFSSGVTNVAFAGQSITYQYAATDRTTVRMPSIMKIHLGQCQLSIIPASQGILAADTYLQPFKPATPLMCPMPQARIPPKAPAIEAAEKNRATRYCLSARLYHCDHCKSVSDLSTVNGKQEFSSPSRDKTQHQGRVHL